MKQLFSLRNLTSFLRRGNGLGGVVWWRRSCECSGEQKWLILVILHEEFFCLKDVVEVYVVDLKVPTVETRRQSTLKLHLKNSFRSAIRQGMTKSEQSWKNVESYETTFDTLASSSCCRKAKVLQSMTHWYLIPFNIFVYEKHSWGHGGNGTSGPHSSEVFSTGFAQIWRE